ncbi:hypothetical protein [uncultured Microbacterium sp.]|uniref:hypothetical protein n=1 Tax=uncultured Microbacterium sp. TaxID=191216 RepID=UPI0035CB2692
MSGRIRVGALAAGILTLALVISGCAGEAPRPRPSATALPTGVSATMMQLRSDVATRQAQILVHNSSPEVLTISAVRVDDPRFAGVARRLDGLSTTISPGVTADIRIQLPLMKCSADDESLTTPTPTPTPEPVPLATATSAPSASPSPSPSSTATMTEPPSTTTVTVHYQLGASIATATEPVSTPVPFLDDLYARECLAERVAKTASLSVASFTASAPGQPADLALSIRPTGNGEARIVAIQGTSLLGFDNGSGASATVFPIGVDATVAGPPVVVHVPLRPMQCNALALKNDRSGTLFSLAVEQDDAPGEIDLGMSAEVRDQILAWVGTWCGIAP